ncbi:tetracycline efflux MFS transporter Tet(38) [Tetragenococcus halophilus]|uniref:MFS transporter n=1 Tax=Tetragenococcus halophilus TaxID=51669 RepID=UPI001B65AECC|nr:MFS transporter [Tetragenococcus halophilus]GFK23663.1 tetracycline efflux MFS transporter Tet(38) [Tetragenococcus halophilus]GMG64334.1 tetracycline efflux MFS transporter Tet(38) [Tetragenococcus halophilus]GMG66602.1 tetracycline efflux MFS transporter Tet(38) [Tetragenococcus halophilus]GMG69211.1 tetracycline efflux MFS transporter Tet(38) [Tetragenococcus halophilus]GMQ74622.1 tetracycline efflux MFS transporter Tet(38) [Tetragenococcus halophilus]
MAQSNKNKAIFSAMPWVIFLVFMQVASDRMFNIIAPAIATDLNLDVGTAAIIITVGTLVLGVAGAVYSTLSDVFSPKSLFVFGAILFALGSIMGFTLQFSYPLLVLARAIQVTGAGVIPGCFVVLVRRYMDAENQAKYLGINTAMYQLSAGLGAVLGGYINDYIDWPFVFLVPVIVLAFIPFYIKYLPDEKPTDGKASIDFVGIVLVGLIVTTMLFGINEENLISLLVSLGLIFIYSVYALKAKNPIIDLRLFKTPKLLSGTLIGCGVYGVQSVVFFIFAFVMIASYDMSAGQIGLMYIPANFAGFLAGMFSGTLAKKVGVKSTFYIGTTMIIVSLLMFSFLLEANIWLMWVAFVLFGVGYATIYAGYYTVFTKELPEEITGRAMAVRQLFNTVFTAIAITLVGAAISSDLFKHEIVPTVAQRSESFVYANLFAIMAVVVILSVVAYRFVFKDFQEE